MTKTWADSEKERLDSIGKDSWTVEDWEIYFYIENVNAESDYFASVD